MFVFYSQALDVFWIGKVNFGRRPPSSSPNCSEQVCAATMTPFGGPGMSVSRRVSCPQNEL